MCRHINCNNIIKLVIIIKFDRYIISMIIDYQYLIYASRTTLYIYVEVFYSIQAYLIIDPSIISWLDNLIIWKIWFCIPVGKIINAFNNYKKRNISAWCINTFNYYKLFLIVRLYNFSFFMFFWIYNDERSGNYIYHKTSFIKIVEIFKLYLIFPYYIM